MDAVASEQGSLLERFADLFARERPHLDEILGAACELYRINPDDLAGYDALMARGVYCYLAYRWAGKSLADIARLLNAENRDVLRLAGSVKIRASYDDVMRDDLDLVAVKVAERVMLRARSEREADA
jgi:hypothetical protein